MAKTITNTYNDLNDLKYVKKQFTDTYGKLVDYYEFRLYYTEKNYIRLTFGEKQKTDKKILLSLLKNGVIEQVE